MTYNTDVSMIPLGSRYTAINMIATAERSAVLDRKFFVFMFSIFYGHVYTPCGGLMLDV